MIKRLNDKEYYFNWIEKLSKEYKENCIKVFSEYVTTVFDVYPNLKSFSWTQYTPYFNDGDVCVFRPLYDYPELEFTDNSRYNHNYCEWLGQLENTVSLQELEEIRKYLVDKFSFLSNDQYLMIFGGESFIKVCRSGEIIVDRFVDHE